MAVTRESVLQSPTSEATKQSLPPNGVDLSSGQFALNTCVEVYCEDHKNTKAVLRLSGTFSVEFSQDAGLVQRDTTPRLYTTALQNALFKGAVLKLSSECDQKIDQDHSDCSSTSDMSLSASSEDTVATSDTQDSSSDVASAEDPSSAGSPLEKSKDDGLENQTGADGGNQVANSKPSLIIPSEKESGEEIQETAAKESSQAAAPSTEQAKSEEVFVEATQKAIQSAEKLELDFSRVSESASHPRTTNDASTLSVAKKLSKEAKTQRSAALKKKREERKKEHEEQVEDLMEEIAHQREVLRSRRDQKKQKQKLQALQKQLERLCKKEVDDDDYETSGDEEDVDEEKSAEKSEPSSENLDDKDEKANDDVSATEEPDPSAADEKGSVEAEDPNAWPVVSSKAKQEWETRKKSRDEENSHLDGIMDFIGLESVKAKMLEIKTLVDTSRRQDVNLSKERFNTVLVGNSGTGKTTLAKLYAKFLSSLELADDFLATTSGSKLVYEGINDLKNCISQIDERGVVMIDDAHILRPDISSTGRKVLDYLVTEMDRLQGNVIFIFTGSGKDMDTFMSHNQSLQSRIPFTISFDDYQDTELLQILEKQLHEKFNGKMKVDKGVNGLYMRIVARRMGRCRGPSNFGNAREVENTLLRMLFRQAVRLEECRKSDKEADDLFLTMEDIVGPPPSTALESSKAWKDLQAMVGLKSVKESLKALVHRLQINYDRELAEKPVVDCPLNRIFLGNPGTGKTTVAKHYGQIMVDIGLLTDGEVVVKSPADFIGEYLGESENITKRILASTRGKVLIIDEAYALSDSSDESNEHGSGNIYKTAIIDTLVANIQGAPNECILLLGYRDRMERMFQASNPGLSRRFPMSSAFEFDDFTDEELREILDLKLKDQGFTASDKAKSVAMEVLSRARNHRNFGNAGEIDILFSRAKELQQGRLASCTDEYDPFLLESQDFDADFERPTHAEVRIRDLFKDFVGADDLVEKLVGYSRMVQNAKALEMEPRSQIPFNYLFRGPPGTGKTTTARRIGQVFYDMGLLATNQVYDCSTTDLIGEFLGQTGPKTQKVFQRALGKVLFIDEAYRFNDDNNFGKEALIEMLNLLTKEAYKNKLVVILAGYNDDINKLLKVNAGLGSRFPEVIQFESLKPKDCVQLFVQRLEEQKLDASAVKPAPVKGKLQSAFERLSALPDWGNARDVDALAKAVFGRILKDSSAEKPELVAKVDAVDAEVDAMITEREQRNGESCPVTHLYL
ncbi:hypothetical protein J7T55_013133 [Diaporthe amygdali]|uniref:uncharacterized protein n=1 Tax=Phomopsis amygdali TaxID=1214568 RepID=UPI0022FEDA6E|nr:uncharacterized protein J7T55_013133 [Diaporthe amygdali]KAJ0118877.1 hypothetical protein J7T55_013133 [Diaporthe amygdali]